MRILHYALGFPPYRSGGLTKLCIDLMVQQTKEGHSVAMLWPGRMSVTNKTSVKKNKEVIMENQKLSSFEIVNPLPVPFDEGISDISSFIANGDRKAFDKLLEKYEPDVVHIHTLMGLHKSFLEAVKDRKTRLVFTAHDFFPICPKVTMFRNGAICRSMRTCEECGVCNSTALSLKKIYILQSPLYRKFKDLTLIKKLRKQHRDRYLSETTSNDDIKPVGTAEDYKKLRNYYYSLLKLMDVMHYNSKVTKKVYESVYDLPNNYTVSITHSDIRDNRAIKQFTNDRLRIRYLGPQSGAKGFFILKAALDELWKKKQNFCLDIHFTPLEMSPYMKIHERYSYEDFSAIFSTTDILIAPSIWYETFGFTVLEALSYGVPVVISGTVGAKDILVNGAGIVVENITPEKLESVLQTLTVEKLKAMNKTIIEKQPIMQIEEMSEKIQKLCYGWDQ